MKVIVIPDVHLKPYMFQKAAELLKQGVAEKAVCLMDIPDDWGKQYNIGLYEETFDAAIDFATKYPETLWCMGNHDLSYVWQQPETGYSGLASLTVQKKLMDLKSALSPDNHLKYIHKIDNVVFCHGGICDSFVKEHVSTSEYENADEVIDAINCLGVGEMWNDLSPIWLRTLHNRWKMYKSKELLQVTGHTPVEKITRKDNIILCDVFSTYTDGKPKGNREFLWLDTETWEFHGIPF